VPGPGVTTKDREGSISLTFAGDRRLEVRVAVRPREDGGARRTPFRKLVGTARVHLELLVVVVVAGAWHLKGPPHQIDIDTLTRCVVSRRDHIELGAGAALEL